jgi:hypothetical protein
VPETSASKLKQLAGVRLVASTAAPIARNGQFSAGTARSSSSIVHFLVIPDELVDTDIVVMLDVMQHSGDAARLATNLSSWSAVRLMPRSACVASRRAAFACKTASQSVGSGSTIGRSDP